MESSGVPVFTLSSGKEMPILGFGTAENLFEGGDKVKLAILNAIEVGYRYIDTAAVYLTKQSVGEAVAEALQLGLIKSRDELFITSKLWGVDAHPDLVLPALQNSLRYEIYIFQKLEAVGEMVDDIPKDEIFPLDYKSVWAAMEECRKLGYTKSIGVENCWNLATMNKTLDVSKII
ncbi:hypothetical protein MKW92_014516, partial [Papaver armeniacum]